MKQIYILTLLLTFSLTAFAQRAFVAGYFIDNEGNRVECLIRNTYKSRNPTQFEYKLTADTKTETATIKEVQEFGILNTIRKYKRFEVEIDRSSNEVATLSGSREPDLRKELLYLRLLLEGEASLYAYYERGGLDRFFYSLPGKDVEQLVYKKYLSGESAVAENTQYKNQLAFLLACQTIASDKTDNLSYQEKELTAVFAAYNKCIGAEITNHSARKEKGRLMISVKGGINSSELTMRHTKPQYGNSYKIDISDSNFSGVLSPQAGLEVEYVFPFYNKSWSVYVQPSYQQYQQEGTVTYIRYNEYKRKVIEEGNVKANYTHFSLPIGFRYAYMLGQTSRVFVNAAISFHKLADDSKIYEGEGFEKFPKFGDKQLFPRPSYIVGLGYKYRNRYSLEANYNLNKIVTYNDEWKIQMQNSFSVLVGYSIK